MDKEYIEREAVNEIIKQLSSEPLYQHEGEDYYAGVCDVDGELAMLPAADVAEVRHGVWVHKNNEMYCSVCGDEALMDEVYYESPYCPNCGAKMDGKGDDNGT